MSEKTPWNPSVKATRRVKNPLPAPVECDFCGGDVTVTSHAEVYGRDYGDWPWLYACTHCDARVGMHPFTDIPVGTMADAELRAERRRCKPAFERLHRDGLMTRSDAYAELASALGIPVGECHFGWFDEERCRQARAACIEIYKGLNTASSGGER